MLARLYAAVGDTEAAIIWLEKAVEQRSPEAARVHLWNGAAGKLREHPRYSALLRRMNLGQFDSAAALRENK